MFLLDLLSEAAFGAMVVVFGLTIAFIWAWNNWLSADLQEMLQDFARRVTGIERTSTSLVKGFRDVDTSFRARLDLFETNLKKLNGDLGDVRREAHSIEKQVDKLDTKTTVTVSKVEAVEKEVNTEASEVKRIDDQIQTTTTKINCYQRQIQDLEREVHALELRRVNYQLKASIGLLSSNSRKIHAIGHEVKGLKGLESFDRVEISRISGQVEQSVRQLEHLEHEVHHGHNGHHGPHHGYPNGKIHLDHGGKVDAELRSAYRKIEKLMDETIAIEIGPDLIFTSGRHGVAAAQEYEEHYRKLIELAQYIYNDIKKYLPRAAINAMEVEEEQLDWARGELFTNSGSSEAVKSYHMQVKTYLIKLKDVVSKCLHAIA